MVATAKHEHKVVRKFWFGKPYYWCNDCGVSTQVTQDNSKAPAQALLDIERRKQERAKTKR